MSRADSIKAYLDFLKLVLTALTGLLFVIFWDFMQNESLPKNMPTGILAYVKFIVIIDVVLSLAIIYEYRRNMYLLEKEP